MTTHACTVYGLGVQVNALIAGLQGLATPPHVDVTMSLGFLPPELAQLEDRDIEPYYVSEHRDERGRPSQQICRLLSRRFFRVQYSDGTIIVIDANGSAVWATWLEPATLEDTAAYLLGPSLGFVLRLRGVTCLHASAIAIDGQAVALVGAAGAGKSTTAAAFAQLGYSVLSDDVVALADRNNMFDVQPAYPRVRLWPESVCALFGAPDALPRITPTWEKRFLDLSGRGGRFQATPLRLGAIYLLGDRNDEKADAQIEIVSGRHAMVNLVANTYGNNLLTSPLRAAEFELLGRLVSSVPIRKITASADVARLPQLCKMIAEDFRHMTPASQPLLRSAGDRA